MIALIDTLRQIGLENPDLTDAMAELHALGPSEAVLAWLIENKQSVVIIDALTNAVHDRDDADSVEHKRGEAREALEREHEESLADIGGREHLLAAEEAHYDGELARLEAASAAALERYIENPAGGVRDENQLSKKGIRQPLPGVVTVPSGAITVRGYVEAHPEYELPRDHAKVIAHLRATMDEHKVGSRRFCYTPRPS